MRIVTLSSLPSVNISSNASIGCVVDLARHELHTLSCLATKHVSLEELDMESILIFDPTNSWDKKSARLILPSTTLDDSIRTPDILSLRSPASSAWSNQEPIPAQVMEAGGFTVKQTTIRVRDLSELPQSQVKGLVENTSAERLSSSPHAAVQASCPTYSEYWDGGWQYNGSCGATNCWCYDQYAQQNRNWTIVCSKWIRTQCLKYHYADCTESTWNCWLSTQEGWSASCRWGGNCY